MYIATNKSFVQYSFRSFFQVKYAEFILLKSLIILLT